MDEARGKMMEIARQLLVNTQADIKAGGISSNATRGIQEDRGSTIPMSLHIPTFFVAGHESNIATALALHALSLHPSVQSKLREELLSIATDDPTMDELNSFPYLENVVREVMRVYPPVAFSRREAMEDDSYDTISTLIQIPISAVHRDKEIWGADADIFRPERWDATSEAVSAIPSVWGNLLTFLAGPHNCIGFRFSIVESDPPVLRPTLRTEPKGGNQLPLIIRPYLST
ncbi:cytochrome P450 [Mycena olivaceomarginata]|nr:cytochrome P450 [Mycena olivaceomarginata]